MSSHKRSLSSPLSLPSKDQLEFSHRAHRVIPGGAHTYSKGDDQLPIQSPRCFVRAKGARVWDLDENEYVDWGMGIQSVLIGHAEESIDEQAIRAIRSGQNFSRPAPLEVETAEAVLGLYPKMDMVKFAKNGSDANTAAIRLARAITGRKIIAYDRLAPFLAIHDWFLGNTLLGAGIPEDVSRLSVPFEYNDSASIERVFEQYPREIAAVIMEVTRDVKPVPGFLERVSTLCHAHGALLIVDEIISGFRYGLHGAQHSFNLDPDFTTLGKGLANGYSLAALLGKRDYMERGGLHHNHERVFLLSTTNGSESSALAAALATIRFYETHPVIERLAGVGRELSDGLNDIATRHGVQSAVFARSDFDCRPVFYFLDADRQPSAEYRSLFLQETLRQGIFMPWVCPSFRHGTDELDRTFSAMDAACSVYARALENKSVAGLLEGRPVKAVFRKFN